MPGNSVSARRKSRLLTIIKNDPKLHAFGARIKAASFRARVMFNLAACVGYLEHPRRAVPTVQVATYVLTTHNTTK